MEGGAGAFVGRGCLRPIIPAMNRTCERRVIHRGAKFDFEQLTWTTSDGRRLSREVVRHPGAVCILPVLAPGELLATGEPARTACVVLIRNDRIAIGESIWELPAGTLEPGESIEVCAARELEEETGYRAAQIRPIASFLTTPGMTDERMHAFSAQGLAYRGQNLEDDESIRVVVTPMDDVFRMIDAGEIVDAKSVLAILLAMRRGLIRPLGGALP